MSLPQSILMFGTWQARVFFPSSIGISISPESISKPIRVVPARG